METGVTRVSESSCVDCLLGHFQVGGGFTLQFATNTYVYALGLIDTGYSASFPEDKFRIGLGSHVGLRLRTSQTSALHLESINFKYFGGPTDFAPSGKFEFRQTLSRNLSAGIQSSITNAQFEAGLSGHYYF
jgi:hypothetical protein